MVLRLVTSRQRQGSGDIDEFGLGLVYTRATRSVAMRQLLVVSL